MCLNTHILPRIATAKTEEPLRTTRYLGEQYQHLVNPGLEPSRKMVSFFALVFITIINILFQPGCCTPLTGIENGLNALPNDPQTGLERRTTSSSERDTCKYFPQHRLILGDEAITSLNDHLLVIKLYGDKVATYCHELSTAFALRCTQGHDFKYTEEEATIQRGVTMLAGPSMMQEGGCVVKLIHQRNALGSNYIDVACINEALQLCYENRKIPKCVCYPLLIIFLPELLQGCGKLWGA